VPDETSKCKIAATLVHNGPFCGFIDLVNFSNQLYKVQLLEYTISKPWSSPVAKNTPSCEKLVVMITHPLVLTSHNARFSRSGVMSLDLELIVGVQVCEGKFWCKDGA